MIINEDKGNFVPMFLFQCEDVAFCQTSGTNEIDASEGALGTQCSIHYFNSEKGYWEPAFERFSVTVELSQQGKVSKQVITLPDPLNINISIYLGAVINNFLKRWEKSKKRARIFQKRMMQLP